MLRKMTGIKPTEASTGPADPKNQNRMNENDQTHEILVGKGSMERSTTFNADISSKITLVTSKKTKSEKRNQQTSNKNCEGPQRTPIWFCC